MTNPIRGLMLTAAVLSLAACGAEPTAPSTPASVAGIIDDGFTPPELVAGEAWVCRVASGSLDVGTFNVEAPNGFNHETDWLVASPLMLHNGQCALVWKRYADSQIDPVVTLRVTQLHPGANFALDSIIGVSSPDPFGVEMPIATFTANFWHGSRAIFHESLGEAPTACTYPQHYFRVINTAWPRYSEGTLFYSSGKTWREAFSTPPLNNPYWILARRFIGASLNQMNGTPVPPNVLQAMTYAQSYFLHATPEAPIPQGLTYWHIIGWSNLLEAYNQGQLGPGPCGSNEIPN